MVLSCSLPCLRTGMSWSHLRDNQGFGMAVCGLHSLLDSLLSRYYGALHGLLTSLFPNYHLLARGYCPLSLGFCTYCPAIVWVPFLNAYFVPIFWLFFHSCVFILIKMGAFAPQKIIRSPWLQRTTPKLMDQEWSATLLHQSITVIRFIYEAVFIRRESRCM
jgi:hypothetical protein